MDVSDKAGTLRAQEHGHQPVVCFDAHNLSDTGVVSMSLTSGRNDTHNIPTVCLEGNGARPSHRGGGTAKTGGCLL